jgi:hypothetical protein
VDLGLRQTPRPWKPKTAAPRKYRREARTADEATKHNTRNNLVDFIKFPKIPRMTNTTVTITEKIDGTNAQIIVPDNDGPLVVGSRNRFITPGKTTDNYGFASWVKDNEESLRLLGPGRHFGEWWGQCIGRGYGLDHRRFWLFNCNGDLDPGLPSVVGRVPVLLKRQMNWDYDTAEEIAGVITRLQYNSSVAVPGFMNPEGVVIDIGGFKMKVVFDKQGASPEEIGD